MIISNKILNKKTKGCGTKCLILNLTEICLKDKSQSSAKVLLLRVKL